MIFSSTHFDITNFRGHFGDEEYEQLVEEFDNFTKGETDAERENYVREKLLGQKVNKDVEREITTSLKNVFARSGNEIGDDVKPSKILGNRSKV